MVGFVQQRHGGESLDKHRIQCFVGKQTKHYNVQSSVEKTLDEGARIAEISNQNGVPSNPILAQDSVESPPDEQNVFLREERKSHKRYNAHHEHVATDDTDILIETINDLDLGWKADTCKYQTHHAKYGSHCEKEKAMNLAQTSSSEAEELETENFGNQANFAEAWEHAQSFQKKYATADAVPDSELTANFDWRNVEGVDFTNKHRN